MKNKHIEIVKKYLNDPKSVTIEELEANKRDANTAAFYADVDDNAYAAANAAANAYAAAHADATDAYAYTDDAAYDNKPVWPSKGCGCPLQGCAKRFQLA